MNENVITNLLSNDGYIITNKTLMKKLGIYEAIYLGELASQYSYWNKQNKLVQGKWFYSTQDNIEDNTCLSKRTQTRILNKLKELKIISVNKIGMPSKNYFTLNIDVLIKFLTEQIEEDQQKNLNEQSEQSSEQVDPNQMTIFDNYGEQSERSGEHFQSEHSEQSGEQKSVHYQNDMASLVTPKVTFKSRQIGSTSHAKSDVLVTPKVQSNNNNINNNKYNNNSIYQSNIYTTEYIKQQIDFDRLIDSDYKFNKDEVNGIVNIMCEIMNSKECSLNINQCEVNIEIVKDSFKQLDMTHIQYVLDALKNNNTRIKNLRAYLITTLYNAPTTIDFNYQSQINNDLNNIN